MERYAYKVYYDGAGFYGSQRQRGVRTVEDELMKASVKTGAVPQDPSKARFASAGRTDRFVSALGNVFAVNAERELTPAELNSALCDEIRVWARARVPSSFNPRLALRRRYKYLLRITSESNLGLMAQAGKLFLGVHDFRRFAHRAPQDGSMRDISELSMVRLNDGLISITVTGDSFLRRMVRKIVGALICVASGLLGVVEVQRLFDPMNTPPPRGVPSAPPENLILWDIDYGFDFEIDEYALSKAQASLAKTLTALELRRMMLDALKGLGKAGETQNGDSGKTANDGF
ncbi:MAG: tRNA pseudouridine(38-40) synthase TruA [Promethearchaeati archaeon SRVP18_Atabeyarchaeia-1]